MRVIPWRRCGLFGVQRACRYTDGAPADPFLALLIGLANRGTLILGAEAVAAAILIAFAADLASLVNTEAVLATLGIGGALSTDEATAVDANFRARTFHGVSTFGHAVAIETAELTFQALSIDITAVSGGAESLVASSGGTIEVDLAGGDLVHRDAVAAASAELPLSALGIGAAGDGTETQATDFLVFAVGVQETARGTIAALAFIRVTADLITTDTSGAEQEEGGDDKQGHAEGRRQWERKARREG